MSSFQLVFFIGLFGSVHCMGMCGPLAFAVPSVHRQKWLIVADKFAYNFGRLISYSALGLICGLIGRQLWLTGLQRGVSFLSGFLIIMAALSALFKFPVVKSKLLSTLMFPVYQLLNLALKHRAGHLIIGILNGFLPCGFVYLALVGAINSPTPIEAAQYMFWFGAGTFPLMLAATVSSGFINPVLRRRITRAMPYLMVCLGFWFILRGMGLNIPYLSPDLSKANGIVCH